MHESLSRLLAAGVLGTMVAVAGGPAESFAQRIVCWKDASGRTIGCGDTVPPEYRDAGTRELDPRGVTRRTTGSAEEERKRRALERERERALARQKAEERKRIAEQRRQDTTLLATYTHEHEIDEKRDRELQQIDLQIDQYRVSLRNVIARHGDLQTRIEAARKAKRPVPEFMTEDLANLEADRLRLEQGIAAKEEEKEALHQHYVAQRHRFLELHGRPGRAAAPASRP
jgi:hypothetical protein